MTTISHRNFNQLLSLIPDLANLQIAHYLRFEAGKALMPLSVDVLFRQGNRLRIAMAHNFEMNGDLVPDPDMELEVDCGAGTVEALTFQDQRAYREVCPEPGIVRQNLRDDLNSFLSRWLTNIRSQGFELVRENVPTEES